jgi:5-carboxymethyl-2-hydroxymuconate isomerase
MWRLRSWPITSTNRAGVTDPSTNNDFVPHLILEFARGLAGDDEVPAMLDAVHGAAVSTGLFQEEHIKTRAIPVLFYRTGTGTGHGPFIHAQLRIKSGRDEVQKRALSQAVLAAIRGQGWPAQVITVEVVDMDAATYAKHSSTE